MALLAGAGPARAASLRYQIDQNGDFALIGNTLGRDCAASIPAPVVGTVGACGNNTSDSAPDVFWQAQDPTQRPAALEPILGSRTPVYVTVAQGRQATQEAFTVEVRVEGRTIGAGKGSTKRLAEQAAARDALTRLNAERGARSAERGTEDDE